jgi:HD-GYP domain-containing protein (c-di-GMP phosphodiesterase class II)
MLKKIPIRALRMGMHLHKLEGSWMAHPFWKTRFVIDSTADLNQLKGCGLAECWIDTALGLDVAAVFEGEASVAAAAAVASPSQPSPPASPVSSSSPADRPMAAELKQAAAICQQGRAAVTAMFSEARMGKTVNAEGCLPLVQDISDSVLRNPGAIVSLARLKTRDDYSYMHSVAVCALMVALARQTGMNEEDCRAAGLAGLMHDVGKALMPLDVLTKPGKLTESEYAVIRTHPERGHGLLLGGQGVLESTLDVALHHHERMDGAGYPHRLVGEQISLLARMGAVCDVYDAISSNRPYKAGWDPAQSIARMASWKGHFDPAVFAAFVQSLGIYPTGSLVKLESGKLAVVVEQTPGKLVAPVVMVFFSTKSQMHITPVRLDLSRPGTQDRITGREEGGAARFPHLDELWADPDVLRRMKP